MLFSYNSLWFHFTSAMSSQQGGPAPPNMGHPNIPSYNQAEKWGLGLWGRLDLNPVGPRGGFSRALKAGVRDGVYTIPSWVPGSLLPQTKKHWGEI